MENRLLKEIERLRIELNKFGLKENLTDQEVIELSQQLDELLNQYQKFNGDRRYSC